MSLGLCKSHLLALLEGLALIRIIINSTPRTGNNLNGLDIRAQGKIQRVVGGTMRED